MKSYYIEEDDIYYVELREGKRHRAERRQPCIVVDLDADGNPLSVEIVGASMTTSSQLLAALNEFGIQLSWAKEVA